MKKTLLVLVLIVFTACYQETAIVIEGDFIASFVRGDESVPVNLLIINKITGADTYEWTFEGGSPSTSSSKDPGEILYEKVGTYFIKLTATNVDGETKVFTKTIVVKDGIKIQFSNEVLKSNYSPVEVVVTNNTVGEGFLYSWDFQGGTPAKFIGKTPPNVIFTSPGDHKISLTVSNGFENETQIQTIKVSPYLVSMFTYEPATEDDDYEAPVKIILTNSSISATHYKWSFQNGLPATSIDENPTVVFTTPGSHEISLEAFNDKTSQVFNRIIDVKANTNLRVFTNIKLGTNAAHNNNTIGAMFSTITRTVYKANEITNDNSNLIDIVFQGLNSNFTYNKFISPDQVSSNGFLTLKNAQNTIFVNYQSRCNCGLNFTESQFDAMVNDTPLKSLNIEYTAGGYQEFGLIYPRIILFKTQEGKKGAIKIKDMVKNGTSSYILIDIKIQKQ
ncbi:PKD domain-containing protein [Flavobacterium sp. P4023]|uniref:PKD domain-containing protein n=1 Tax=Flavobacterium flabelliforme TaxID=2816119 RepID=A0ABS5CWT7_9FLAO|nr:PKD domain-containing protein [Flavobacterium flabelliforme]MBP4143088.1 PKD domain-containing protein [Flavobacterium flabelliforme]